MNLTAIEVEFGLATAMDTLCSQAYGLATILMFIINWYTEAFLVMIGQPAQVAKFAGHFSRVRIEIRIKHNGSTT
ncbi:unnamed protein product [Peronospora farinosa]|uniref:Uncharacterized protein n=1 Tax=Peronospora farinosa TaxID=134698 RepID=A0AAV0TY49_9STRA|nr:unnamed protein product [Peronospora farinosa]